MSGDKAMSGPFNNSVRLLALGVLMLGMQPQARAWQAQNDRRNNGGARPQAGGQHRMGPKIGTWLRENRGKSFDQQRQSLESDPDYRSLPPEKQQQLQQRLQNFNNLPPEQQDKVLHRFDTLNHMSPQQRAQARALLDRMRVLPPERRAAIRQYFHNLVGMNRQQRQHALGSPQFSNQFNPDEREIIQRGLELNDENSSQDVGEAPK